MREKNTEVISLKHCKHIICDLNELGFECRLARFAAGSQKTQPYIFVYPMNRNEPV